MNMHIDKGIYIANLVYRTSHALSETALGPFIFLLALTIGYYLSNFGEWYFWNL